MPTRTINIFGNRRLDARPDRLDLRDRPYMPPVASLPPFHPLDADITEWLPAYVKQDLVLDQGTEGACTGFGLAAVIHYLFWRQAMRDRQKQLERVSTRMLYHLARFYDEWAGEDYDGSSCRGALKGWHRHGVCSDALWPYLNASNKNVFVPPSKGWERDAMSRRLGVYYRIDFRSVVDIQAAIWDIGAVYVSADVHDGWNVSRDGAVKGHDTLPHIKDLKDPKSLGGHAFALVGYNPTGFVVQNSWGVKWGRQGFAILPYDEWVRRGSDAWVCALGVPSDGSRTSSVVIGEPRLALDRSDSSQLAVVVRARADDSEVVTPWTAAEAYRHSIVMGNEGRPLNRIVTNANDADSVRQAVAVAPQEWLKDQPSSKRRLVIYAHGGLNSEGDSLNRIRVLAPCFKANGIYPLFVTWKTGPVETLLNIIDDQLRAVIRPVGGVGERVDRLKDFRSDVADRSIELAASPIAKPLWSQMKQNASASVEDGRGTALLAEQLTELASTVGSLEVHLIGHSAGSILLGHFLDAIKQKLKVRSCTLYAPACTVAFANRHYQEAITAGTLDKENIHVHVLSDALEREDSVGPYGKSLLYLVSRALESAHKTPLLGMVKVFDPLAAVTDVWNASAAVQSELVSWRNWWRGKLHVVKERRLSTGTKGQGCPAAHGCFDNHADTITATLERIRGGAALDYAIESLDY